jgi:hypothetical protein
MKYDGIEFTNYDLDSGFSRNDVRMLFQQDNNFYSVTYRYKDTTILEIDSMSIFKYNFGNWERIFSTDIDMQTMKFSYNIIENVLYAVQNEGSSWGIYSFNGSMFVKIIDIINELMPMQYAPFGGNAINDMLIDAFLPADETINLFNWNGKKWSREIRRDGLGGIAYVKGFGDKYFCVQGRYYTTYVFVGRRKPQNLNLESGGME